MIGHDKFRFMTADLTAPGIPNVGQVQFSKRLYEARRCVLAWQKFRRVFVICRLRGDHVSPRCYMDLGPNNWPLGAFALMIACDSIDWADATMGGDPDKMIDVVNRYQDDKSRRENRAFIDDRFPDFWTDFQRTYEILNGGPLWGRKQFLVTQ